MKLLHTPGPWIAAKSLAGEEYAIIESASDLRPKFSGSICQLFKQLKSNDPELEKAANARLIAAAPDMLQALVDLRNDLLDIIVAADHPAIFIKLNNAISQATK